jgi:hypothetical protein
MPHQETLNVIAEVGAGQDAALEKLLERIPQHVGSWSVVPFEKLRGLHFARFILLDKTEDLKRRPVPAQLLLMTNVDAPLDGHIEELTTICGAGIDRVFSHCVGYPAPADCSPATRRAFMKEHMTKSAAVHINRRGRSVEQIRQEENLRREINKYLDATHFGSLAPAQIREQIVAFVSGRKDLEWAMQPAPLPALAWRIKEKLHFWAGIVLVLVFGLLALLMLPLFLLILRYHEKRDKPDTSAADPEKVRAFRNDEDFWVQNQIVASGFLKAGWFRQLTTAVILIVTDYFTRHIYNRGKLSGLNTIHFARWVRINGSRGLIFTSNYDGSLEAYMNDFIDKAAWGLNAIFTNGDGFPRTCYMACGGITDEKAYKRLLPTRQRPSNVWYSAYPHLTTKNIANNEAIRAGLSERMDEGQTRHWLRRFGCGNELPESGFIARQLDRIPWETLCHCCK